MGALLGLMAAVAYGASDFAAGVASRRFAPGAVTAVAQIFGLITAAVALVLFPGVGPTAAVLGWGAISGLGSAMGTLSLYHGLSAGRMSVVATLSAVLTAVIPAVAGGSGDHLSILAIAGIVLAIPAIGLVSWKPKTDGGTAARTGVIYGVLAGLGFALLFIALDRAGTHSGAWPLLPGQAVSVLLVIPFALHALASSGKPSRAAGALTIGAGIIGGTANLLFLAAAGRGQLAVVAVLTALYPAVTVVLARAFLAERWTRLQTVGLLTAAAAIALVSAGLTYPQAVHHVRPGASSPAGGSAIGQLSRRPFRLRGAGRRLRRGQTWPAGLRLGDGEAGTGGETVEERGGRVETAPLLADLTGDDPGAERD